MEESGDNGLSVKFDEDGKEQILDAIKDGGVQQTVEIPQVQYLDKVFLQFIDQVVDISVVAQRLIPMVPVFPKTTEVSQLQYVGKEVDVAVCRSCRYAQRQKPVKLPQVQYLDMVCWNSSM